MSGVQREGGRTRRERAAGKVPDLDGPDGDAVLVSRGAGFFGGKPPDT